MQVKTIIEQLLFSTVRIETVTPNGIGAGTAFIFNYNHNEMALFFLVTNKHVIKDAKTGKFFFTIRKDDNPEIGQRFDVQIDNFEKSWFKHPNNDIDVAICFLNPILNEISKKGVNVYFRSIGHELIPNSDQLNDLDALEEVVFIGYPNGIFDSKNLLPVIRRGTTATHIQVDYDGKPIFFIDASVFPGSSGSPVLIVNTGSYMSKGGLRLGANRILFLGILSSVAIREEHGEISYLTSPTALIPYVKIQQMIDLGIVIKSVTILETVDLFIQKNKMIMI